MLTFLQATTFPSAADWDGDGIDDVLHLRSGSPVRVAYGPIRAGEPVVLSDEIDALPEPERGRQAVAADWDGDGRPDLLLLRGYRRDEAGISLFRNVGRPGRPRLGPAEVLVSRRSSGEQPSRASDPVDDPIAGFCVGDWDGDGRPDLVVTRSISRSLGRGEGGTRRYFRRGTVWVYLQD